MSVARPVPEFQHHIQFGRHQLPIDTAKSISVHPGYLWGKQTYEVSVRFDTLRGGKPYGWGDFNLKADTLQKAEALVEQLRGHNLKWNMWVKDVRTSLQDRTIDLTFDKVSWAGTVGGVTLNWGDLYMMFQRALGLTSADYEASVVEIDGQRSAVRLTFKDGDDLKARMEAALLKLDRISENHQIRTLLKGDQVFKMPADEDEKENEAIVEKSAYDDSFKVIATGPQGGIAAPTSDSNFLSPIFDVTEDTIESRNRFY